jgi:hypothetical protein
LDRTLVLVSQPLQLTAFIPGESVVKSPLMFEFMDAVPEQSSKSGVSGVMLPEMPFRSTMHEESKRRTHGGLHRKVEQWSTRVFRHTKTLKHSVSGTLDISCLIRH